ncbi:hypothetical protein BH20ACI3_BH20ACI3_25060 [soil metagenome]
MSKSTPRRLRMNRAARLRSAKHWLPTYTGRDVVKGYRKWYGVSSVCAIIELRQLGFEVDEQRLVQAKRTEESKARERARKRQQRAEKRAAEDALVESGENFAYIAGCTEWGFPYGVTWEELKAEKDL